MRTTIRSTRIGLFTLALGLVVGCASTGSPESCSADRICVNGTTAHYGIEGGFWAIRGDDSVTYDPVDSLPSEFRTAGIRVRLVAKKIPDAAGIHQAGPIVEIISIRRLK